jgi:hypothetical protein
MNNIKLWIKENIYSHYYSILCNAEYIYEKNAEYIYEKYIPFSINNFKRRTAYNKYIIKKNN